MMDCRSLREVLDLYVDSELSPEAAVQADAHISSCSACMQAVERLKRLRQAVKVTVLQYQTPPNLVKHVRKSILSPWRRGSWIAWVAAGLLLAATAGLLTPQVRGAVAGVLESAASHIDRSRTVVMEGKLLCRDCQLKEEYGYHAMCPLKGHHGALQTHDGKIWNILEGDASEALIHNSALLGRSVRIRGRIFRSADSVEVNGYELL